MAPITWSKKKEPSYACLSETEALHSYKMWTEVSSSAPHILQVGLLFNPITYRCLLRVFCPVRRPVTTLYSYFVLTKHSNRTFVIGLGPEVNFPAYLWVLPGPRHLTKCWLSIQRLILFLTFCLGTPRNGSGLINFWREPPLASLSWNRELQDEILVRFYVNVTGLQTSRRE